MSFAEIDLRDQFRVPLSEFPEGDYIEIYDGETNNTTPIWTKRGRRVPNEDIGPIFSSRNVLHIRFHASWELRNEYREVTSFRGFRFRAEIGPGKFNIVTPRYFIYQY